MSISRDDEDIWQQMADNARGSANADLFEDLKYQRLWGSIHRAAKTNPGLQDLLNQVVEFYMLSKK